MAKKGRAYTQFDINKDLKGLKDTKFLKELGQLTVEESKKFIKRGISPVDGAGRYEDYSGQKNLTKERASKRSVRRVGNNKKAGRGYPYNVMGKYPDKKVKPVNLFLSGNMLKDFSFEVVMGFLRVGWIDDRSKFTKLALYHNEGTKNMPARPILPTVRGEQFNATIRSSIQNYINKKLEEIIKRSKK